MNEIIRDIIQELESQKATDVVFYDVKYKVDYTDFIIICSSSSSTHSFSLIKKIYIFLKKKNILPLNSTKNIQNSSWLLLDYGDFIIHIFYGEDRQKYNLEKIYSCNSHVQ